MGETACTVPRGVAGKVKPAAWLLFLVLGSIGLHQQTVGEQKRGHFLLGASSAERGKQGTPQVSFIFIELSGFLMVLTWTSYLNRHPPPL